MSRLFIGAMLIFMSVPLILLGLGGTQAFVAADQEPPTETIAPEWPETQHKPHYRMGRTTIPTTFTCITTARTVTEEVTVTVHKKTATVTATQLLAEATSPYQDFEIHWLPERGWIKFSLFKMERHQKRSIEIHSDYTAMSSVAPSVASSVQTPPISTLRTSASLPSTTDSWYKYATKPHPEFLRMLPEDYYRNIALGPQNIGSDKFTALNRHHGNRIDKRNGYQAPCNLKPPASCIYIQM